MDEGKHKTDDFIKRLDRFIKETPQEPIVLYAPLNSKTLKALRELETWKSNQLNNKSVSTEIR